MTKGQYQNLHTHTTTSDGQLSYPETLEVCRENNVGVVAFTDHDSLIPEESFKKLQKANHPVRWVSGVEISSGAPRELKNKDISMFHIVGLFVDPFNEDLKKCCQKAQGKRIERMKKMVKNLNSLGFNITEKDCFEESAGKTVGRPHIVSALFRNPKNIKLIKKLKNEIEKKGFKTLKNQEKFAKLIKEGERRYIYRLFLSRDAYIKKIYVPYLYSLEFDEGVRLIRNAGGVAILAHWTFCKKQISLSLVEKFLKEKRLDGVEVIYNHQTLGLKKEILADMKKVKALAEKYQALQSGGNDSHSKNDVVKFFDDEKYAKKTIGLAQKMIQQKEIDTTWSSL